MAEPENLVLDLLRAMRAEAAETKAELKAEIKDLRGEMNSLRADMASDMLILRKDVTEQIAGLRRAVVDYHSSVVGHGVLISELDTRVRRIEDHLHLGAPA